MANKSLWIGNSKTQLTEKANIEMMENQALIKSRDQFQNFRKKTSIKHLMIDYHAPRNKFIGFLTASPH